MNIRNHAGEIVDVAKTANEAFSVVAYLDRTNPAAGPHTCNGKR